MTNEAHPINQSDGQMGDLLNCSINYKVVMHGSPIYMAYLQTPTVKSEVAINEGLHFSGIVPIKFHDQEIACLNVASHSMDDMPIYRRSALENLSFQLGNLIDRLQVLEELAS
jgi:two-component system, cell cycle sensor histidine kinase and response regulator CckA